MSFYLALLFRSYLDGFSLHPFLQMIQKNQKNWTSTRKNKYLKTETYLQMIQLITKIDVFPQNQHQIWQKQNLVIKNLGLQEMNMNRKKSQNKSFLYKDYLTCNIHNIPFILLYYQHLTNTLLSNSLQFISYLLNFTN